MKEHHGDPASAKRPVARRIDHAMNCRDPRIVRPLHHEVTDVHHEGARHITNIEPSSLAVLDLKSAWRILDPEDGERAVIGMRPGAQLPGYRCIRLIGIVDEADAADLTI